MVGNEAVVEGAGRRAYPQRTVAPHGSFAEYAVVDPSLVVPLPDDVADHAALPVGIPGLASWMSLSQVARVQPCETVVVVGATGAVGPIAVQVARVLGAGHVVVVLVLVYGAPLVAALHATRPGARVVSTGAWGDSDLRLPFPLIRGRTSVTYSNQLTDPAPKREAYVRLIDNVRGAIPSAPPTLN